MGDVTITLSDVERRLLHEVLNLVTIICEETSIYNFSTNSDEKMNFLVREIENWWCDEQGIPEKERVGLVYDKDGDLIVLLHPVIDYFIKKLGKEIILIQGVFQDS